MVFPSKYPNRFNQHLMNKVALHLLQVVTYIAYWDPEKINYLAGLLGSKQKVIPKPSLFLSAVFEYNTNIVLVRCPFCLFWAIYYLLLNKTTLVLSRRSSQSWWKIKPTRFFSFKLRLWLPNPFGGAETEHFKHMMFFPFKSARQQLEECHQIYKLRGIIWNCCSKIHTEQKRNRKNSLFSNNYTWKQLLVYLFPNLINTKFQDPMGILAALVIWQEWGREVNVFIPSSLVILAD